METTIYRARSDQNGLLGKGRYCSVSTELQSQLGVEPDHHIRIDTDDSAAYYAVDQIHENEEYPLRTAKKGRSRLALSSGNAVRVSTTIPQEDYLEARRTGGFAETVWDDGRQDDILFIAPHGGDIEFGTEDMAIRSYKAMQNNGYRASAWMAHGFNNSLSKDAFTRWHIEKPSEAIPSYPGLKQVSDREFDYCVSFHMQGKDTERGEYYIGVGGSIDDEIRHEVADQLRTKTSKTVETDLDAMKWSGTSKYNSANFCSVE